MKFEFSLQILFDHLFGDFAFQNNWMALNKKSKFLPCVVHCAIYSLLIVLFCILWVLNNVYNYDIIYYFISIYIIVFIQHFIIDKLSVVDKWLHLIKSRSYITSIIY